MKYLKLFEQQFFSSREFVVCPFCKKEQTEYPYRIVKWGVVNYDCEFCKREFQVEKEEIYHSSEVGVDWDSRKIG